MNNSHHERFDYSPIVERDPFRWPNGARVAIWVVPNIEHFHFTESFPGSPDSGAVPDVPGYSLRDYGNRVGIWRMMGVLDRHEVPVTAAINSEICRHAPAIVDAGVARGWEWMAHGTSNSVRMPGLTPDDQRELVEVALGTISDSVGTRPRGWLGPGLGETAETPDVLRQAGLTYVADWVNDDQPFAMRTTHGDLYSIPYAYELNDKLIFGARGVPASRLYQMVVDQFDVLYAEGAQHPRVMGIALHPFITGQPFRSKYLDQALGYLRGHDDVWWATGSEIVDAYRLHATRRRHETRDGFRGES